MARILVVECMQEISSFNPVESTYEQFVIQRGQEVFDLQRGMNTSIGGALEVLEAIGYHHDDYAGGSLWPVIVSAADAISGARPGARRESLETYIKRLESLERIANSFQGVEKSYAIQAGREVRVIVRPDTVDDAQAQQMARDIARKVESDVTYPGQIRITVVRESRATDLAK